MFILYFWDLETKIIRIQQKNTGIFVLGIPSPLPLPPAANIAKIVLEIQQKLRPKLSWKLEIQQKLQQFIIAQLCHVKQQGSWFAVCTLFGYYAKNVDHFIT